MPALCSYVQSVGRDPTLTTFGRVSRSSVVKLAILKGVDALAAEYK